MNPDKVAQADLASEESKLSGDGFTRTLESDSPGGELSKRNLNSLLPEVTSSMNNAQRTAALQEVLELVADDKPENALSEEDFEALWEFFKQLYVIEDKGEGKGHYRHQYAAISTMLYAMLQEGEQDPQYLNENFPQKIEYLSSNITALIQYIESKKIKNLSEDDKSTLQSIRKLGDHIGLELPRMRYQIRQNSNLHNNIQRITESYTKDIENQSEQIKSDFKQILENESDDFKDEVHKTEAKSQRNYVSVLGIFISVVTAFSAGIRLSSEVVETIAGMGIYRMVGTLLMLGAGLGDMILVLLYFILVVSDISGGPRSVIKAVAIAFNVVMLLLAMFVMVAKVCRLFG